MYWFKKFAGACLVACMSIAVVLTAPASAQEKKPKPQTLFINVHIFDGKSETLLKNRRVLVEGNLIKAIGDKTPRTNGMVCDDITLPRFAPTQWPPTKLPRHRSCAWYFVPTIFGSVAK